MIGDLVAGAIEAHRSGKHKSACLVGWRHDEQYFPTQLELGRFGFGASPGGIQKSPNILWFYPLSQLGRLAHRRTKCLFGLSNSVSFHMSLSPISFSIF